MLQRDKDAEVYEDAQGYTQVSRRKFESKKSFEFDSYFLYMCGVINGLN